MPDVRSETIRARVTPGEFEALRSAASLADLTVSAWVRRMLLASLERPAPAFGMHPADQRLAAELGYPPAPDLTIHEDRSHPIDPALAEDSAHRHHREVATTTMVFGAEVKTYRCRDCGIPLS